jgi:hypothetical protein
VEKDNELRGQHVQRPIEESRVTRDRRGIAISRVALLLFRGEITLGTGADVDLPLQAYLKSRHASIERDSQGDYYLNRAQQRAVLTVNHQTLGPAERRPLRHNDVIRLGSDQSGVLNFSLPLADSQTAVLTLPPGAPGLSDTCCLDLMHLRNIVLLADYCVFGHDEASHVRFSDLPCSALTLGWFHDELLAVATGGRWEDEDDTRDPHFVDCPSTLTLKPSKRAMDRLVILVEKLPNQRAPRSSSLKLQIIDPFADPGGDVLR